MFASRDIRVGVRQGNSQYQYTLWSPNLDELLANVPKVVAKVQTLPELVDVTTDREQNGLQANVVIDRQDAARYGVQIQDIDNALNNAFSQRQISTIYSARNQYRVVLEIDPLFQRDPSDLTRLYVAGADGVQVPLSSVARIERGLAPLVINHQGPFPSVTVTYNLAPDITLSQGQAAIDRAVAELHLPESIRAEPAGDARAGRLSGSSQPLVILAAILAVYIILGVLYESLAHPLTIISTLPPAGLGALLALMAFGTELTVIAFIGIILLIGIVKKNGIMMVDFALTAERQRGLAPDRAIREACLRALPSDPDDDACRAARRPAAGARDRAGLRAAASARHHHHRRPDRVADAHAVHDAGDLLAARPAAPPAWRRDAFRGIARARHRTPADALSTDVTDCRCFILLLRRNAWRWARRLSKLRVRAVTI